MWLAFHHLRVIRGELLVEHANILMLSQRHTVGIEESAFQLLVPYQIVPPQLCVAHHKLCREHSGGEKQDCPVVLDYPLILLPKRLKRDDVVPLRRLVRLIQNTVWQITENHIHGLVTDALHDIQTITKVNRIVSYH